MQAKTRPASGGLLGVSQANCPIRAYDPIALPSSFDVRDQWPNCTLPIRQQGNCGCCWAFASTESLTERFCIKSKGQIKRMLAPQNMICFDHVCQATSGAGAANCDNGCNGGYVDTSWLYIQKDGVVAEACQPYTGVVDTSSCNITCSSPVIYRSTGCYWLRTISDIQTDIFLNGPVEASLVVYENFYDVMSLDVYTQTAGSLLGGHVLLLIGWGTDENGVDYWTGQNQWGPEWGAGGYFRIARGINLVNIETYVVASLPNMSVSRIENEGTYFIGEAAAEGPASKINISVPFTFGMILMIWLTVLFN